MAELFASGRVVDLVLGFMALEALALAVHRRRTGRGLGPAALAGLLLPGLLLLLALRAALAGAPWYWVAACLLASLPAHLADLRGRWRSGARSG